MSSRPQNNNSVSNSFSTKFDNSPAFHWRKNPTETEFSIGARVPQAVSKIVIWTLIIGVIGFTATHAGPETRESLASLVKVLLLAARPRTLGF
jgi:hypothetical protein